MKIIIFRPWCRYIRNYLPPVDISIEEQHDSEPWHHLPDYSFLIVCHSFQILWWVISPKKNWSIVLTSFKAWLAFCSPSAAITCENCETYKEHWQRKNHLSSRLPCCLCLRSHGSLELDRKSHIFSAHILTWQMAILSVDHDSIFLWM